MDQTKRCPMCGESILAIAVRCRYCQADLPRPFGGGDGFAMPAVDPHAPVASHDDAAAAPHTEAAGPTTQVEFEQRFLEFAYTTDHIINAPSVAYALKVPIDVAIERLEDLAARDVLIREVDTRGSTFFHLPGRQQARAQAQGYGASSTGYATRGHQLQTVSPPAVAPFSPPIGELVGRDQQPITEGTALAAVLVNALCLPGLGSIIGGRSSAGIGQLLLFLIGIPLCLVVVGAPMLLSAWIWSLVTGIDILNQAKAQKRLQDGGGLR